MKNWKTTAIGIGTAICYLGYKLFTHQPITGQDLIWAFGAAGIGFHSEDSKPNLNNK